MRKQTPLQRKMSQKAASKKHRDKKRAEAAYRREMTKQAKEMANSCSEPWTPDYKNSIRDVIENNVIEKSGPGEVTRTKTSIKKILLDDEAQNLFYETKSEILCLREQSKKIKRLFYLLERGDVHVGLKYKSESDVFRELSEVSLNHRSMLQKYRSAAKIEVELGRSHDQIPTAVLLELMAGTDVKSRKEIWSLINIDCYHLACRFDDGIAPLPTVQQVKRIKKDYQAAVEAGGDKYEPTDAEIEKLNKECVAAFEAEADKYDNLTDAEIEKLNKEREVAFEAEGDKYDFTDKQIKRFRAEREAFVVDKYDLTDKQIDEYQAAFSGCQMIASGYDFTDK